MIAREIVMLGAVGVAGLCQPDHVSDHICSIEEAAVIDFVPWPDEASQMLSAAEWNQQMAVSGDHAIVLRLAQTLLVKNKTELMALIEELFNNGETPDGNL